MAHTLILVFLNPAVQLSPINLKFHCLMDFACQTYIGLLLKATLFHLQIQRQAAKVRCHTHVEQATTLLTEPLKAVLFPNWFKTNGCLFLL